VFDARTPSEATAAPAVRQFSEQGRVANKSRDPVYTVRQTRSAPPPGAAQGLQGMRWASLHALSAQRVKSPAQSIRSARCLLLQV